MLRAFCASVDDCAKRHKIITSKLGGQCIITNNKKS